MGSGGSAPETYSTGSTVVQGLSCSWYVGSCPDQGLNLCLLHWEVDSLPPSLQGSPRTVLKRGVIRSHGQQNTKHKAFSYLVDFQWLLGKVKKFLLNKNSNSYPVSAGTGESPSSSLIRCILPSLELWDLQIHIS